MLDSVYRNSLGATEFHAVHCKNTLMLNPGTRLVRESSFTLLILEGKSADDVLSRTHGPWGRYLL
jgi:hypothetical protein